MKIHPKRLLGYFALVAVMLLTGVYFTVRGPSYTELKESCYDALAKSPRSETLDAWMEANHIGGRHSAVGDDDKDHFVSYLGMPTETVDKAVACTSFQTEVRGGLLSRHMVYGYFLFSADGTLVDSRIRDIYFGLM